MTSVVHVHVGAPKSGTTYLQNVLWHNREALAARGLLYPGDPAAHVRAALDLRGATFDGHPDPAVRGEWARLVTEIRDWGGPAALISQELLSAASPGHVARALADLAFAEVHLVYTARDLARQIPAHWQEDVKNRSPMTFGAFVTGLRDPSPTWAGWVREFWRMQDAAAVLERWARDDVPAHRVHVVTLPPPGAPSELLLERFCQVIDVDAAGLDTSAVYANPSLGVAETELIRRINLATRETVAWPEYDAFVKHDLAQTVLTARGGTARIRLPATHLPWAERRSKELVEALRAAGYQVSGDLADLIPGPAPGHGTPHGEVLDAALADLMPAAGSDPGSRSDPDRVPESEVLDAALDALSQMLRCTAVQHRQGTGDPLSVDRMRAEVALLKVDTAGLVELVRSPVREAARRLGGRGRHALRVRVRRAGERSKG